MRFSCESCGAQYMISDEKVGPNGVRVRCKKCENIVSVKRAPALAPEIAPAPPPAPDPDPGEEEGHETSLERELGDAFESVFGGGSPGLAAEAEATAGNGSTLAPPEAPADSAQDSVASAEAVNDWYVAIDDSQVGPLPAPGVKARWESGEIGPDTLAWRPGMTDWVPLSTIAEMAQYLAPVPLGDARPAVKPEAPASELVTDAPSPAPAAPAEVAHAPAGGAPSGAANGAMNGLDTSWKPSAASALAALASEEIASLQRPEQRSSGVAAEARGGSLLDRMDLPDGGVDPTNLLPLSIKGLEPTSESTLKPKPAPAAPERIELNQVKKSATRSVLAIGIAMAVLFAGGIAVVAWLLRPAHEAPAVPVAQAPVAPPTAAPPIAAVPPPAATVQSPAAAAPPSATPSTGSATAPPTIAGTPPPGVASATPPAAQAEPGPAPAPPQELARAAPLPEREPAHAAASRSHRRAKPEPPPPPPPRASKKSGGRLAAAEPAPPPPPAEQPRRKTSGDPLLDVGGDDDVEKELSGKGPKRSVYVPPAIGSDLPESVSVSQINEAVVGQKAGLVRCIDQQRAADPDTRGTLKVRWIISGDGSVRDVRLLSEEFARQPIAPCITAVLKGIHFPRSRTSGQEVVFPFKF